MEYYDFNFVLDLCNKRKQKGKTPEYDLGKAREKFTEIVDAVLKKYGLRSLLQLIRRHHCSSWMVLQTICTRLDMIHAR